MPCRPCRISRCVASGSASSLSQFRQFRKSGGWRASRGITPRHWARPGDRFDRACCEHRRNERDIDLMVVELIGSYAVVTGSGGDQLRPDDIISGERLIEDTTLIGAQLPRPSDAVAHLAQVLGLPKRGAGADSDWSPIETELGVALPADYKTFVDAYGAGLVDDHLTVCAPDAVHDWADLVRHNIYAHECVRLDFAGPEDCSGDWQVGDASRWALNREDVPSWFEPGDNLISWGHTGNGDFLFWHVEPGTAPDDWPVVLKERGPGPDSAPHSPACLPATSSPSTSALGLLNRTPTASDDETDSDIHFPTVRWTLRGVPWSHGERPRCHDGRRRICRTPMRSPVAGSPWRDLRAGAAACPDHLGGT